MNLRQEAMRIAKEVLDEAGSFSHAQGRVYDLSHSHKVAHCEDTAMQVCIDQDTRDAIEYLEEYEAGVVQPGDRLCDIVCRVATHTLIFAAFKYLGEPGKQNEPNE